MKKYGILIWLSLAHLVQAQSDDHFNPNPNGYPYPNAQDHASQTQLNPKSTPAKDAGTQQNAPFQESQASVSKQDQKSTPAKDATQEGKQSDQKKSNKQEEPKKTEQVNKQEEKKEEEKPKSPHTFTSNVSFVSDYRFRGISQTMRRPAIQGGFDYAHVSGFYAGTWASNVDGTTHFYNNTSMEWDFYGGYKGKVLPCSIPDWAYNIGLIYYYYPGGKTHAPRSVPYNTAEFYIEFTYKWFGIKYWQTLTNYFGICSKNPPFNWEKNRPDRPNGSSRGSNNIEASLNFELMKKVCFSCLKAGKLSLLLVVGHQTVRNYEHLSCTHWRATLTQEFDWFNVFLSYVGTNARHAYFDVPDNAFDPDIRHLGVQGVVLGVIRTF